MKKRGMLLTEETLKIVIAVICIIFLAYFLTSLYLKNKSSADMEFAESSLNFLVGEIESGQTVFEIYNPKGWVISSWPQIFKDDEKVIPNSCLNVGWQNCICICGFPDFWEVNSKGYSKKCDKNGFCLNNDLGIEVENKNIKIEKVPFSLKLEEGVLAEDNDGTG